MPIFIIKITPQHKCVDHDPLDYFYNLMTSYKTTRITKQNTINIFTAKRNSYLMKDSLRQLFNNTLEYKRTSRLRTLSISCKSKSSFSEKLIGVTLSHLNVFYASVRYMLSIKLSNITQMPKFKICFISI